MATKCQSIQDWTKWLTAVVNCNIKPKTTWDKTKRLIFHKKDYINSIFMFMSTKSYNSAESWTDIDDTEMVI